MQTVTVLDHLKIWRISQVVKTPPSQGGGRGSIPLCATRLERNMAYRDLIKKRAAELRWYYRNKEKVRQKKALARMKRLSYIRRLKEVPCIDCGMKYPYYVMDFDHIEGTIKLGNIATIASTGYGQKTLKSEIEKCDVVCVNCHRIRTHKRKLKEI